MTSICRRNLDARRECWFRRDSNRNYGLIYNVPWKKLDQTFCFVCIQGIQSQFRKEDINCSPIVNFSNLFFHKYNWIIFHLKFNIFSVPSFVLPFSTWYPLSLHLKASSCYPRCLSLIGCKHQFSPTFFSSSSYFCNECAQYRLENFLSSLLPWILVLGCIIHA